MGFEIALDSQALNTQHDSDNGGVTTVPPSWSQLSRGWQLLCQNPEHQDESEQTHRFSKALAKIQVERPTQLIDLQKIYLLGIHQVRNTSHSNNDYKICYTEDFFFPRLVYWMIFSLIIDCCVTNYHKLTGLKQHILMISQLLWVKSLIPV